MKLIVLFTTCIIAFSYGEKLDRTYLPPSAEESGGSGEILQAPVSRPIVVVDNEEAERQIDGTVIQEEEIQGPDVVEIQRPVVTNVITNSAAVHRPVGFVVDPHNQAINEAVHIGNRGNIFVQQHPVEYKEVLIPGQRFQVVEQRPERTQAALERNAATVRQEYKSDGDAYAYAYETENGIWAEENAVATNGVNAHGGFSYIGDDGVHYSMTYTADENGFQPQGDHIPAIPEEILRSLEQNARDEAAGIFDDGSYDELKYGGDGVGSHQLLVSNVVASHPVVPTVLQRRPAFPTIIEHHPTVPTIVEHHPTVPTIIEHHPTAPTNIEHQPTVPTIIEHQPTVPTIIEHQPTVPTIIEHRPTAPVVIENRRPLPAIINHRPAVPVIIQNRPPISAIIDHRPGVPVVIQNRPPVPTIVDQGASNEDAVVVANPLLPRFRVPGYRYPTILINRKNAAPVVNTLVQEVRPRPVNKAYLPPVKRKASPENRPSNRQGKMLVMIRTRVPEYKKNINKS